MLRYLVNSTSAKGSGEMVHLNGNGISDSITARKAWLICLMHIRESAKCETESHGQDDPVVCELHQVEQFILAQINGQAHNGAATKQAHPEGEFEEWLQANLKIVETF